MSQSPSSSPVQLSQTRNNNSIELEPNRNTSVSQDPARNGSVSTTPKASDAAVKGPHQHPNDSLNERHMEIEEAAVASSTTPLDHGSSKLDGVPALERTFLANDHDDESIGPPFRMPRWFLDLRASATLANVLLGGILCLLLKAWEGFSSPVAMSQDDIRAFKFLTIVILIALGQNLLETLKRYASTLRWSILARSLRSLEEFDLILELGALTNIVKLMVLYFEGPPTGRRLLGRFGRSPSITRAGPYRLIVAVLPLWLFIDLSSQFLVALLGVFWPIDKSTCSVHQYSDVSAADLSG